MARLFRPLMNRNWGDNEDELPLRSGAETISEDTALATNITSSFGELLRTFMDEYARAIHL